MDDEEEDMSRPVSQLWGSPFRDAKHQDRATQTAAGQALVAVTATATGSASASSQHQYNNNSISLNALPCRSHGRPRMLFHGNAGFRSHFPARFEPMGDLGERRIEEEEGRGQEEHRMEERPQEEAVASVEAQIGRKLREIGDQFHQDHLEVKEQKNGLGSHKFLRHQREHLPFWLRLTMAVFGFLFPREAVAPHLRGEER